MIGLFSTKLSYYYNSWKIEFIIVLKKVLNKLPGAIQSSCCWQTFCRAADRGQWDLGILAKCSQTYRYSFIYRNNTYVKEGTIYYVIVLFWGENLYYLEYRLPRCNKGIQKLNGSTKKKVSLVITLQSSADYHLWMALFYKVTQGTRFLQSCSSVISQLLSSSASLKRVHPALWAHSRLRERWDYRIGKQFSSFYSYRWFSRNNSIYLTDKRLLMSSIASDVSIFKQMHISFKYQNY